MPEIFQKVPRLAISVFDAGEVRAAIAGGADSIDCEDPRASIGMFEPRVVTNIGYAVRQASQSAIPTSANIGLPQVLKSAGANRVAMRSLLEIQAKAAQEALGLAAAMDVGDARPNIIKFEVDGLKASEVESFVGAVKSAIRNSRQFQNHLVVASFLELNREVWEKRRTDRTVIAELLKIGEFYFDAEGKINLNDYFKADKVAELMKGSSSHPNVSLIEPSDPAMLGLPTTIDDRLRFWVDRLAKGGADGVLIDTPMQAKVANISLLIDQSDAISGDRMPLVGTFTLGQLKMFTDYCDYLGPEAWLAGSIQPSHAAQLAKLPSLDVIMCRGAASEAVVNPYGTSAESTRAAKRISVARVRSLAERIKGPLSRQQ
jgi:uncharacterized protein (UPF0264 family)